MLEVHKRYLLQLIASQLPKCNDEKASSEDKEQKSTNLSSLVEAEAWWKGKQHEPVLLSGVYWTLASVALLERLKDSDDFEDIPYQLISESSQSALSFPAIVADCHAHILALIQSCFIQSVGGYAPHPQHTDSILATMSAVQCLLLLDRESLIPKSEVIQYVAKLQDGNTGLFRSSISSSVWCSDVDMRFSLCALVVLHHLGVDLQHCDSVSGRAVVEALRVATNKQESANRTETRSCIPDGAIIDFKLLTQSILSSQNLDGGFGSSVGNESHSGYTYCAVASLALLGQLDRLIDGHRLDRLSRCEC